MKATKVEVGQIRDVASGPDLKDGVHRHARVVRVNAASGRCEITNLEGKNRRAKWLEALARCPVIKANEVKRG